jgi:hypothetical protein
MVQLLVLPVAVAQMFVRCDITTDAPAQKEIAN